MVVHHKLSSRRKIAPRILIEVAWHRWTNASRIGSMPHISVMMSRREKLITPGMAIGIMPSRI
jgi:hypothetical protein